MQEQKLYWRRSSMARRKLPSITELARALRAISEQKPRGVWVTVLWYPDSFWELSFWSPKEWAYDIQHKGLRAAQVWVPGRLVAARELARDVRDLLREEKNQW